VVPLETGQCAAQECEEKLTTLVQLEELRRRDLSARIDALRGQLESERNQREKLESQLEALKSLEAQIKNRDGPQ
jgi:DNA repair exonuclease SbcCD ATPase subunit